MDALQASSLRDVVTTATVPTKTAALIRAVVVGIRRPPSASSQPEPERRGVATCASSEPASFVQPPTTAMLLAPVLRRRVNFCNTWTQLTVDGLGFADIFIGDACCCAFQCFAALWLPHIVVFVHAWPLSFVCDGLRIALGPAPRFKMIHDNIVIAMVLW